MYNPYLVTFLIFFIGCVLVYYVFRRSRDKSNRSYVELGSAFVHDVLVSKVPFYLRLSVQEQEVFRERVGYFLKKIKISPEKGAMLTDEDQVLIAASGTIPLIHFKDWAYENLDEVIVYPDYFDERYDTESGEKNISGMVGTGAMNHKMVLSLPALRAGFERYSSGNTAVHEFVHLIDKADGEIDGIPAYLIPKDLIDPWVREMDRTIRAISRGDSAIRQYAATNDAEFLAVLSEYFFSKPKLLKEEHPDLYDLLDKIYNRHEQ